MVNEIGWERFAGCPIDFAEVLADSFVGPLDSGYLLDPGARPVLEALAARYPLVAHSNYGNEFGFEPLEATAAVRRHLPFAHTIESPYVADHLFYGSAAVSHIWSSPLQFSRAEIERVAARAAALQDRLQVPLLHEDAFLYAPCPGSDLPAAEFVGGVAERAGTHLLLDLHNAYANSVDHPQFDRWAYLRALPLDRVLEVHLAGGQWIDGWYHDFHNAPVPEPVWEMLAWVLPRAPNLRAIVLEMQGPAHHPLSRPVDPTWPEMARVDLQRAREMWTAVKGAP
jgi:hypothetical protein